MDSVTCDFCECSLDDDARSCPQCGAEIYWAGARSLYVGEVIGVCSVLALFVYLVLITFFNLDRDIPLLILVHGLFAVFGVLFWSRLDDTPRRRFRNRRF